MRVVFACVCRLTGVDVWRFDGRRTQEGKGDGRQYPFRRQYRFPRAAVGPGRGGRAGNAALAVIGLGLQLGRGRVAECAAPGGTVAGAFLASVATGTSGILFSASDFQSPGDRVVVSGDTLNVVYTFSLDAV